MLARYHLSTLRLLYKYTSRAMSHPQSLLSPQPIPLDVPHFPLILHSQTYSKDLQVSPLKRTRCMLDRLAALPSRVRSRVFSRRLSDFRLRDHILLFYLMEGDTGVRAHSGSSFSTVGVHGCLSPGSARIPPWFVRELSFCSWRVSSATTR